MNQAMTMQASDANARLPFNPRLQLDFNTFSALRKLLSRKPKKRTFNSRFACYLALYLPDVAADIDEEDFGIIHLEIAVLAKSTREAIDRKDWVTVQRNFAFIADMLEKAGKELQDAIHISYFEYLLYDKSIPSDLPVQAELRNLLTYMLERLTKAFGSRPQPA